MRGSLPHGWEPDSRFLGLQCSWRISSWFRYDWEEDEEEESGEVGFAFATLFRIHQGRTKQSRQRRSDSLVMALSPSSPAGSESFDPRGQPMPQPTLPSSRDKTVSSCTPHPIRPCCLNMPKHPHACICHHMTFVTWEIQLQDTRDTLQMLNEKYRERLRPLKHGRNSVVRGLDAE